MATGKSGRVHDPFAKGSGGFVGPQSQQQAPQQTAPILQALTQAPQQPPVQMANTSQANPVAQQVQNTLLNRANTDMGASDAMRLSNVGIRDQASGLMKELRANRARRGVLGTGVDDYHDSGVADNALRQIAGVNSKIAFDSERAKDAQLFGVGNLALSQDASQRADRDQAVSQYSAQTNAAAQQQNAYLQRFKTVLDFFGGNGLF